MIDDLRGSLASVQAENKVSLFFQHFSNFFWLILKSSVFRWSKIELTLWWSVMMKAMAIMMTAATVMKAITTMNNCYTGHDSYLLEWEGYISKVLINYEFFFQDLKENLDNLKDIQSQLEQNIPHVRSIISENIFGMTLNAYIHWSVSHSCQFVYLHIFSIFFCCSVTGWFLCKSVFIVQPEG